VVLLVIILMSKSGFKDEVLIKLIVIFGVVKHVVIVIIIIIVTVTKSYSVYA
jgi:hypothetical protein